MKIISSIILSFFGIFLMVAQQNKTLFAGTVSCNGEALGNINIVNRTQERYTVSSEKGAFFITAKVGDELVFSSVSYKPKTIVLQTSDFDKQQNIVLEIDVKSLEEVVFVRYDDINAVKLGIIKKQPKTLTTAERRYYASSFSGGGPIIGLICALNGQAKYNKKVVEYEKHLQNIALLSKFFNNVFFSQKFFIPIEFVEGFKFYVIENADVIDALKRKNVLDLEFVLAKLAVEFNNTIKEK